MPRRTAREKKRRAERPPDNETGPPRKHRRKARSFDEICDAFDVFKREHGHKVPCQYAKYLELGVWVTKMRMSKGTKLTPQQKARLDQLGFDWETKKEKDEKRWNVMLEKLKEYRKVRSDCCVPQRWSEDPQLAKWVKNQRHKETNNKLPPHHKEQLDAINFRWSKKIKERDTSVADEKWLEKCQMLVEYREDHGDCLVPLRDSGPDAELGNWVNWQRQVYRNGMMKKERKKWLDEIGFGYRFDKADPKASRTQTKWDAMFQHLEEFKEEYGHVDVNAKYCEWGLGKWVDTQRTTRRNGTLDQRRATRLQEIGIKWGKSNDERWEDGFAMLHKYQKFHGHCRVPHRGPNGGKLRKESNRKLSNWVRRQKQRPPVPERRERLDGIGFPWDRTVSSGDYYSDEGGDAPSAMAISRCDVASDTSKEETGTHAFIGSSRTRSMQRCLPRTTENEVPDRTVSSANKGIIDSDSSDSEFQFEG